MGIFDGFFKQLATGDQIKDFKHASRLYVDNNYALSPKFDWLYHVYFDLDPTLTKVDRDRVLEAGMLVKQVDLPKYTIDTKTFNMYNRPDVIQTKVKYDTVQIAFHDDQSDVVRNLWFDYFNHYYRDMDASYADSAGTVHPLYHSKSQYRLGQRDILNNFGYTPRNGGGVNGPQYIQAVRIYSLHQKKFSEYTLVNPMIVAFSHGSHNASSNGSLEHSMTLAYTTMLYASGYVTKNTVKGFADLHYDKSPSPLTPAGGGTNSILGPGGIVSALDGFVRNPAAGAFGLFRSYEKNKNVDLAGLAGAELLNSGMDILNGRDPRDRFFIPAAGSLANRPGRTSSSAPGAPGVSPGSVNSNGSSISLGTGLIGGGAALALSGKPELGVGLAIAGLIVNNKNQITGGSLDKTVNIEKPAEPTSNAEIASGALQAVSSSSPLDFFSFGASLQKVAKEREAKAKAEQAKKDKEVNNTTSSYFSSGTTSPTFATGTATAVTSTSPLAQTPYNRTVIPGTSAPSVAFTNLASTEAKQFVDNGNPQPALSYAGNQVGRSTNPENT
jgi:hypothetical protein